MSLEFMLPEPMEDAVSPPPLGLLCPFSYILHPFCIVTPCPDLPSFKVWRASILPKDPVPSLSSLPRHHLFIYVSVYEPVSHYSGASVGACPLPDCELMSGRGSACLILIPPSKLCT